MKKAYPNYTVSELCRVLKLSSSGFYYKKVNRRGDIQLHHQIQVISSESNHTYGKRRFREELVDKVVTVSLYKVAKLVKEQNIYVHYPKKKHYYPDAGVKKDIHQTC